MPYGKDNLRTIQESFRQKRAKAELAAEDRKRELHAKIPKIKEIDDALSRTGIRILSESLRGSKGLDGRIAALRCETEELLEMRRGILLGAGYDENYDEPQYDCSECKDTGVLKDGRTCKCFSRAICTAEFESSGMARLISKQSFENFSLDYYSEGERAHMASIFERVSSYAQDAGKVMRNMLFMGTTGLGKTHLSSAVARKVIENGGSVVYESAQNIFSDFEYERFSRGYGDVSPSRTSKYYECDLLIIDDLGTEVTNQFTVSCLYNLMNSRIVEEKSMLISTNIQKEEILKRYSDRIISRLFGEFEICVFTGRDIRSQKLRR